MGETLSQNEIDELLRQVGIVEVMPSIIEMRLSEIRKIEDPHTREDILSRFNIVEEIFVGPLRSLVDAYERRVNPTYYKIDLDDFSIQDRVRILTRLLIKYGYTNEQLLRYLPKKANEVTLLAEAKRKGFTGDDVLDNATKVIEARKYVGYNSGSRSL